MAQISVKAEVEQVVGSDVAEWADPQPREPLAHPMGKPRPPLARRFAVHVEMDEAKD